jgi:glucose/arabinose dehydrogenase
MSRRGFVVMVAVAVIASALVGCGEGDGFASATIPASAAGGAGVNPEPTEVALVEALGGRVFERPVEFGAYPGGRVFVADQYGLAWLFNLDGSGERVFIDLRERVSTDGSEEGLLSLALDPAFETNGQVWMYYSRPDPRRGVLSRFSVVDDTVDLGSEVVVLEVEQPYRNHNGGAIRFGPDGMLYLGFGDGGDHDDPMGSGQDRSTLLGSIIRIDVRNASEDAPYEVPADNPFVGEAGVRPEIWAYGVRNPWRMAFDEATGALWVGDVGQAEREEVDVVERGANYGWDVVEGDVCHEPSDDCEPERFAGPVATYDHEDNRCAVIGGYVYRGSAVPEIAGSYVYADLCKGWVWALPSDGSGEPTVVVRQQWRSMSFGTDEAGELYLLRANEPIRRIVSP